MSKPSKIGKTFKGIGGSLAATGIGIIASGNYIVGIVCVVLGIAMMVFNEYKEDIRKAIQQ